MHSLRSPRTRWLAAALLVSATLPRPAEAQDLPYTSGSTGADGALNIPGTAIARNDHAMAYDAARQRMVIFGGTGAVTYFNDTWEYNGTAWTPAAPTTLPPGRNSHAMVYDASRQKVVLFGGKGSAGNFLDDTWEYNGTTWTQMAPAAKPAGRNNHSMVYDSTRNRVILFGGNSQATGYLDDTWEYNGTTWTQVTTTAKPAGRYSSALSYDSARQRVLLFGGLVNGSYGGDTWEYNPATSTWTQVSPSTVPANRSQHSLYYDATRQRSVLFGGLVNGSYGNDLWEYNGATSTWTQVAPPSMPATRAGHTMVYNSTTQRAVLFGGLNPTRQDDTWEYNGTAWSFKTGSRFEFDMTARASGVWNFTTINIPSGVTVSFKKNAANTPVQWLASGAVTINGDLDLTGSGGRNAANVEPGNEAPGGPGGYDGGLGGRDFNVSGSYIGTAGGGPGGGKPGAQNQNGEAGKFNGAYGNSFLQPLIGGSGGGGGASYEGGNGGNGGGGGGAILIASSADIVVNGTIDAAGGAGAGAGRTSGAAGSGGGVRLVADRISGSGIVRAGSGATAGRIRMEAYYRPLAANGNSVSPSSGPPTETFSQLNNAALTVAAVDGVAVRVPAGGSTANPDVIFNKTGTTTITVTGTNIPNGTPIKLRISGGTGILELPASGSPAVVMNNNTATFTATVPAGVGTVQAFATIPLAGGGL